jgi:hypothetical protein
MSSQLNFVTQRKNHFVSKQKTRLCKQKVLLPEKASVSKVRAVDPQTGLSALTSVGGMLKGCSAM